MTDPTKTPRTKAFVEGYVDAPAISARYPNHTEWGIFASTLERELAAEKADAKRYRWLRANVYFIGGVCNPSWPRLQASDMPTLDAAIDAATQEPQDK